ncbi:MAG: winged helix-turn-helix transcriptional regulator [Firmicutes bacterium]|nr:winged helix-turn-helix transcriptional regulator [Bacillota bacterium]
MQKKTGCAHCESTLVHTSVVEGVRGHLVDDAVVQEMAGMFKMMADPTRLKLINALMLSEMCVCDLTELMGMSQSAVSHQLAALRKSRLIKSRRDGKQIFYSLDDEHIGLLFNQCLIHSREE